MTDERETGEQPKDELDPKPQDVVGPNTATITDQNGDTIGTIKQIEDDIFELRIGDAVHRLTSKVVAELRDLLHSFID